MTKKSENPSINSMAEATRGRAKFSDYGNSLGAAGFREINDGTDNGDFLSQHGQSLSVNPPKDGFENFRIGVAWDNIQVEEEKNFFKKLLKKTTNQGVDLDLGCFYELEDGTRGVIQAFGEKFGNLNKPPFIRLSGDERTGDADGDDEFMLVNGQKWHKIKRILVYLYIYEGATKWADIRPQINLQIPGEETMYVSLSAHHERLCICSIAEIQQVRGGLRLTNMTEYFPGHEEMDRAFGFGLEWADGSKD